MGIISVVVDTENRHALKFELLFYDPAFLVFKLKTEF